MINERQAKKYCKEDLSKIKNYEEAVNDTTQTWHCHHMTETWWNCTAKDLIDNECYYNRKACELIFLTRAEHRRLHMKGKHHSDDTRRKISESMKDKGHWNKGKTMSDETRRKMSEAKKGDNNPFYGKSHTEEHRRKLSEAYKGKTWKVIDGKRVWYSKEAE